MYDTFIFLNKYPISLLVFFFIEFVFMIEMKRMYEVERKKKGQ